MRAIAPACLNIVVTWMQVVASSQSGINGRDRVDGARAEPRRRATDVPLRLVLCCEVMPPAEKTLHKNLKCSNEDVELMVELYRLHSLQPYSYRHSNQYL